MTDPDVTPTDPEPVPEGNLDFDREAAAAAVGEVDIVAMAAGQVAELEAALAAAQAQIPPIEAALAEARARLEALGG